MKRNVLIGSRGSDLALWQANHIKDRLTDLFPGMDVGIKIIRTTGDQLQDVALSKIGDKGLFTRQIENELLDGQIDFAVHSLKDLQTQQPEGLTIGAVCEREVPNDILVSRNFRSIDELPRGASIATGSLRRRGQLLNCRPDLEIVEIRGNVPTRLNKYLDSQLDGMILAYAGIHRLNLASDICHLIPTDKMLTAVGQGAIAVETRTDDEEILGLASALDHRMTRLCVTAERAFLRRLQGGCQVPIGALASVKNDSISLDGMVSSLDGSVMFRESLTGRTGDAERTGLNLAELLIEMGAEELLAQARQIMAETTEAVL
jgi:hydroxymethylbilane synthase